MSDRHHFDIDGAARLVVSVPSGRMDVYRTDSAVIVEIDGNTEGIEIGQSGNTVTIASTRNTGRSFGSTRIKVGVPEGCDLDLAGASLEVYADVPLGHVKGRTASGDVSVHDAASLSVRSASGDIHFAVVSGDVDITMASGDVFGSEVRGALGVSVASGDVRIDRVDGDISAKSASGDIWISRTTGRDVRAKSMSGTVAIGVAAGTRVELDISTLSGDIHRPSGSPSGSEPSRTMDLSIKTVSGDIRLTRAD